MAPRWSLTNTKVEITIEGEGELEILKGFDIGLGGQFDDPGQCTRPLSHRPEF